MNSIKIKIEGLAALIQHNAQMVNALNPWTKAMKKITGKQKKTEDDLEEMARIEWMAGVYANPAGNVIVTSDILEAAIRDAAKSCKRGAGKVVQQGVIVEKDMILDFPDKKKTIEDLCLVPEYTDYRNVRVQQARIIRTRPIFHQWGGEFTVLYQNIDKSDLVDYIKHAGMSVGICDYRPKYGRFAVVKVS